MPGVQFVSPIADFPTRSTTFVRAIDLDGVFYTTKAAWKHLVARGRGRIVNIASVHGLVASVQGRLRRLEARRGRPHAGGGDRRRAARDHGQCDLSRRGDDRSVRGQAADLVTSYGGGISEEQALERAFLEAMPTKRFIDVAEVGALCAFLCSDYAVSITGAPIAIDGGWSAH